MQMTNEEDLYIAEAEKNTEEEKRNGLECLIGIAIDKGYEGDELLYCSLNLAAMLGLVE